MSAEEEENTQGGALVALRVMHHALRHAVGAEVLTLELVLTLGQQKHLGQAMAVHLELARRELLHWTDDSLRLEIGVELRTFC